MIIKIADIPPQGRDFEFELDPTMLNERVNSVRTPKKIRAVVLPPEYLFVSPPAVKLRLQMIGSSVHLQGSATGKFRSSCSRCAEDVESSVVAEIKIVLKPRLNGQSAKEEFEDVGFGYFDGKVVDSADIIQEFLIINLPFSVNCDSQLADQCANAQATLNKIPQNDITEDRGDERFAIFRSLKVNGKNSQ